MGSRNSNAFNRFATIRSESVFDRRNAGKDTSDSSLAAVFRRPRAGWRKIHRVCQAFLGQNPERSSRSSVTVFYGSIEAFTSQEINNLTQWTEHLDCIPIRV